MLSLFCFEFAEKMMQDNDPSHDLEHANRVHKLARYLAGKEGADLDIVIPASIGHDLIVYPKDSLKSKLSATHSAAEVAKFLQGIDDFPRDKIVAVMYAIQVCSFSKGIVPTTLEAKILQDADLLEAVGAVAIMRTFASAGSMNKTFYSPEDPFCVYREPDAHKYALDLFYTRLLQVEKRLHTQTARELARPRTKFLHQFLTQLTLELPQTNK